LGTGNFGKPWAHGAERAEAKKVFDAYVEAGGNFVDSADSYQFGESEEIVGEFIAFAKDERQSHRRL
jgi:aryl-alcohol dehydrogenase-like predicted oxidoreductase